MTLKTDNDDTIIDICIFSVALILVILKICGVITIPWIWLTSPIWIPFIIGLLIMFSVIGITTIKGIIRLIKERKNERN